MYQDAFSKLEIEETAFILDQINPELEGVVFDPDETMILAAQVPFYKNYRFLDISDEASVPAIHRYVLYKEKAPPVILNWTNGPIYALNKNAPIKLTKSNIEDYVRFFFKYVRGAGGRFFIAENVDDINWKEEPPLPARKALGKMLKPVTLIKKGLDGTYHLEATLIFKDSLFQSQIQVKSDGSVSLSGEELLVEEMPILDEIFGQ